MGGGAPAGGNFLDQMSGIGMMNPAADPIVLNDVSELDSERFQQLWMQLPIACGGQTVTKSLRLDVQVNIQLIESKVKDTKMATMASG